MSKDQLMSEAMKLDPVERERFAEELRLSLTPEESDIIDAAILAEVKRRDADYIAGKATYKPVDEVIDRLLKKSRS